MPSVIELQETDTRFVRKWGNKLLAVMDYSAPVPAEFFGEDHLPILPDGALQLGFITTDGVQQAVDVSTSNVQMDQQIDSVRSDVDGLDRTMQVTFGESNAWTKALSYGVPLADWPESKYVPSDFDDGDFVDFPYMRVFVIASDGVGDQAFYRVEYAYRAKVTGLGNRTLQRSDAEVRQFTFGLFRDPTTRKSIREIEDGPGFLNLIAATGATAGTPGAFTPVGAYPPGSLAILQEAGIVANPATAWTTGQSVVLGDASHAYWDGDSWAAGTAA